MIAVTFALPAESSDFVKLLQRVSRSEGSNTISGTLHGQAVTVLHTGVGEKTTRASITTFLRDERPQLLISTGFAGALSDRMNVGDLLLAENYSAPGLVSALSARPSLRCVAGTLATAPRMIDSLTQREELGRTIGADAVDMETQFIAEACAAAEIPMLSLRAISDTPAAPFPAPPHVLFDLERQRTPFASLFTHLITHPAAIGRMFTFGRQITRARQSLTRALDLFLRSEAVLQIR